jgi:hypothetical protein
VIIAGWATSSVIMVRQLGVEEDWSCPLSAICYLTIGLAG